MVEISIGGFLVYFVIGNEILCQLSIIADIPCRTEKQYKPFGINFCKLSFLIDKIVHLLKMRNIHPTQNISHNDQYKILAL